MTTLEFIEQLYVEKKKICLYLVNGIKLNGVLIHHDSDGFILERDGKQQAILRTAVSTISRE